MGVEPNASTSEIKQVFRQLALQYHPDRNHSKEAEVLFKELNEAYQVLSNSQARQQYDLLLLTGNINPEPEIKWHRDPAYRRKQESGYKYQPPREPSARFILIHASLRYFKWLSWVGCVWCALLGIDFLAPRKRIVEIVATDDYAVRRMILRNPTTDLLVTENGYHFPVSQPELKYFPHGSELKIVHSSFFSLLIQVRNYDGTYELNNLASIYRNFAFAPLALCLVCGASLLIRKQAELRFNLGVVTIILAVMNIIFFFSSRIAL